MVGWIAHGGVHISDPNDPTLLLPNEVLPFGLKRDVLQSRKFGLVHGGLHFAQSFED